MKYSDKWGNNHTIVVKIDCKDTLNRSHCKIIAIEF